MILTANEIAEAIEQRFKNLTVSVKSTTFVRVNLSGRFRFRDEQEFDIEFFKKRFQWEVCSYIADKDDYERTNVNTEDEILALLAMQVRDWRKEFSDMLPKTLETFVGMEI